MSLSSALYCQTAAHFPQFCESLSLKAQTKPAWMGKYLVSLQQ